MRRTQHVAVGVEQDGVAAVEDGERADVVQGAGILRQRFALVLAFERVRNDLAQSLDLLCRWLKKVNLTPLCGPAEAHAHATIASRSIELPAMRNPLQEQLLKAGLTNKAKAAQAVREQAAKHKGKQPAAPSAEQREVERLRAEKAERDRALAAEHNAQRHADEARAQARQIIDTHKLKREGEIAYRFTDGNAIKSVLINAALRAQLASGALVVVRHGEGYELLPRAAADKVRERDASLIVLDHGQIEASSSGNAADDEYYKQFEVPDDLVW